MACWNCGAAPADRNELSSSVPSSVDLAHLLSTNDNPSDVEITLIQNSLAVISHRMDALNARIGALIAERDGMAEQLQKYSSVLSPVRRIPPELVCEIFSWTLPLQSRNRDGIVEPPPWYLGHICRPWRDIALGQSALWRIIGIYHSANPNPPKHSSLAAVQTQLARSSNALLDVHFEWWMGETIDASPFLDALLPHSDRWESLYFGCNEVAYPSLGDLFLPVRGRLAGLQKLELDVAGDLDDHPRSDIFAVAPRLREVLLTDPNLNYFPPPLLIPFQQITRYRGIVGVQQLIAIFQVAPDLVEGAFASANLSEGLSDVTNLTLPNLRRLYIEQSAVLVHLTAPKLEYLSCDAVEAILPLVQRSSCHLSTLILTHGPLSPILFRLPPDDLISLLKNIPSLENLLLEANGSGTTATVLENDSVLRAMTLSGSADDLCPNLKCLAYGSWTHFHPFSTTLFIVMIRSRIHPARRLGSEPDTGGGRV